MRIVKAFGHSIDGVREAIANHTAFRQELIITTVLVPIAIWLGQNGIERSILIGTLLIILIVELLNSAIESTVDRIGKDKHVSPLVYRSMSNINEFFGQTKPLRLNFSLD